jgi:threonine-phosphate decarboxylase
MTFPHGGNIYEIALQLHCSPDELLDFSASINPLGSPPGLWDEFRNGFSLLQHYPDIANRALIESLADFHGVSPDWVVVGNGSTELIYWLARALSLRKAIIAVPTFSEYRRAFEREGVELLPLQASRENCFQPSRSELELLFDRATPDALLLTHPGSPSGALLEIGLRQWVAEKCRAEGWAGIVDEAFVDFREEDSLKAFLGESTPLVLIRSMTKFYGIPGLRVGYVLTNSTMARRIRQFIPPWSINTFAQIAGEFCIRQESYRSRTIDLVNRERDTLSQGIEELKLGDSLPGVANYLLIRIDDRLPDAGVLQHELVQKHKILVRNCANFEGLDERYFRIAVRLPQENRRLLAALGEWVESHVNEKA